MLPLTTVAERAGFDPAVMEWYGPDKAKIPLTALQSRPRRGKFVLVSAITPTPAGEGKTTTSIGLAQGLLKIGRTAALALRQPSMGPVFGRKGGATGGWKSSLTPAHQINLQFTGDFHAITAANNLIAAAMENRLHFKLTQLDRSRILWKRCLDANDRGLRSITLADGLTTGFNITAASEIMAILCFAESYADLRRRLDGIVLGFTAEGEPVLVKELNITGALMAILKDALSPNLVQSVEGVPAFVHGGPFANIAHGCNSILATRAALSAAEFAVTEAGFAFDLGGEKFLDIKCRQLGFGPDVIVIVATVRALKMHGGIPLDQLTQSDPAAVERGLENLHAHLDAARKFGAPVVVAVNHFFKDTVDEQEVIHAFCRSQNVLSATADVFGQGGDGAVALAEVVVQASQGVIQPFKPLYGLEESVVDKITAIARNIYGADGVTILPEAEARLQEFAPAGAATLPICMAKTQESLSDDPKRQGRPRGFNITVRDFELARGAGFLVALTGKIMRMPALPKVPSAERLDVTDEGEITGL